MGEGLLELKRAAAEVERLLPHRFEIITALADGTPIPAEALSEDHTIGLYAGTIPRKMRDAAAGFQEVEIGDFLPQRPGRADGESASGEWHLEYPPLRGVRFRAERLQYLEEGWWAVTGEVKYPASAVLALLYVTKQRYGSAQMLVNTELPMPLWIRPGAGGKAAGAVEAVVQARGEGRVLFTNIHSECPMEYARQFAEAARGYYRLADEG
jgi:hypothetical protein